MSCCDKKENPCGCCEGIERITPVSAGNTPGLDSLKYRVGTYGSFLESMLAGISSSPALKNLTTRDENDPSIALMDAWAVALDVLTFYQERNINEGFLNTAIERLSLVELARHISYRPKPGVAAEAWLAFFTDPIPGAPTEMNIPTATRVQSIPGQDESPQVFETVEPVNIKTRWNAIRPKQKEPQKLKNGDTRLFLKGLSDNLQVGDRILFLWDERDNWDFRIIESVTKNNSENYTVITWQSGLQNNITNQTYSEFPKVYVFRQRAALFGYNAPEFHIEVDTIAPSNLGGGG